MSTSNEAWPPPPTAEHPWHVRRLRTPTGGRLEEFTVREVRLWGRTVLIDEQHAVWCPDCWQFASAAVLGRADNGHTVGLPYRVQGRLLPMDWLGQESASTDDELGEF